MPRLCPLALLLVLAPAAAQDAPAVLSVRERAEVHDRWLEERLDTVVPALMRREGVDLWIVAGREYNEDPVMRSMLPATWLSARRRTVLLFHDRGPDEGVERLAVARYDVGPFPRAWDPEAEPDQWARLAQIVAERDPERIALNRSEAWAHADGLAATEYEGLMGALSERYRGRVVSGERLAVGWLETRTPAELTAYAHVVRLARHVQHEGLSSTAITPGLTTTDDLAWWYRQRVEALGLSAWFHPSVAVQRAEAPGRSGDFSGRPDADVIQPGDLVWVDFGIEYLGLHTDTQQMAYVLRPGETEAPAGLRAGLAAANRVQDLLTAEFATGRTGNEVLAAALRQSRAEGIDATIYTHPIGLHGHGAGPTVGLWDRQGGVPGAGDHPLFPSTAYAIELNAAVPVPEWGGQTVRFMLEETAAFDGASVRYLDGRQTALLLIPRRPGG